MSTRFLSPKYLERKNSFIHYVVMKNGGFGDEEIDDMITCINDEGIIFIQVGSYIISIFISEYLDYYCYMDNLAILLGAKINQIIFETIEQNQSFIK